MCFNKYYSNSGGCQGVLLNFDFIKLLMWILFLTTYEKVLLNTGSLVSKTINTEIEDEKFNKHFSF